MITNLNNTSIESNESLIKTLDDSIHDLTLSEVKRIV